MSDDFIGQRIAMIRVTNNAKTVYTDRYDGVPYIIEPGHTKSIPLEVAAHLFAYHPDVQPETMFRHVCKRQGWNTADHRAVDPATGRTLAEQLFANLRIEPVIYKMVEENPDPRKPIPADPAPEPQIITAKDMVPARKGMQ
jgi:hypothetical protein